MSDAALVSTDPSPDNQRAWEDVLGGLVAKSDAERQRESRARRKARGETQLSLYLSRATLRTIDRLKETYGGRREAVIDAAVRHLTSRKS